jgi:hypothetical protein
MGYSPTRQELSVVYSKGTYGLSSTGGTIKELLKKKKKKKVLLTSVQLL